MDLTLIKTFLAVANTGSFVAACDQLFITQSAVSLRIQRLEDSLGHPLFVRSKAGAVLTSEGTQFERYALGMLKLWEEARQQIAIPKGYNRAISIGAQYSLWHRLGFRWLDSMQMEMPELSVHCELGMSDRIMRFLVQGVIHAALLYTPQLRPGLIAEPALDDELILVASWPDATLDLGSAFISVDWGPEFTHALAIALPELTDLVGRWRWVPWPWTMLSIARQRPSCQPGLSNVILMLVAYTLWPKRHDFPTPLG